MNRSETSQGMPHQKLLNVNSGNDYQAHCNFPRRIANCRRIERQQSQPFTAQSRRPMVALF
jgi:hypothetical protein